MMAYCDYIAHTIVKPAMDMDCNSNIGMLSSVGKVKMDLAKRGYMQSTKKTIMCKDKNGKEYRITIEEV